MANNANKRESKQSERLETLLTAIRSVGNDIVADIDQLYFSPIAVSMFEDVYNDLYDNPPRTWSEAVQISSIFICLMPPLNCDERESNSEFLC